MQKNLRNSFKIDIIQVLFFIFIIVFFIKLLASFILSNHVDPLNYHLAIAKIILRDGFLNAFEFNTHFLMGGVFDYIHILTHYLTSNTLYTQLAGQTIHFLFSLGFGSIFLLFQFKNKIIGVIGAITLMTLSKDSYMYLIAKNDGVMAFASLITAAYIISYEKKNPLLIGFLLGILPAIKMNGLYMAIPLGLIYIWQNRFNWKNIFFVILTAILTWSPSLIRNFYFTQNPFFPGLVKLFPGNLHSEALTFYADNMSKSFNLALLTKQITNCFFPKILFFLLPVFIWFNFKWNRKNNLYIAVICIFLFLYLLTNGGVTYPRFFFACHFLLVFYFLLTLTAFIDHNHVKIKKIHVVVLLFFILVDSKLDQNIKNIFTSFKIYKSAKTESKIIESKIPHTIFWSYLEKVNEREFIISDAFTQFYHAPAQFSLEQPEHNKMANFLFKCTDNDLVLLKRYSYALLSLQDVYNNSCYQLIKSKGRLLATQENTTLYLIRDIL